MQQPAVHRGRAQLIRKQILDLAFQPVFVSLDSGL